MRIKIGGYAMPQFPHEDIRLKSDVNARFDIYLSCHNFVPEHWHRSLEVLYIYEGMMEVLMILMLAWGIGSICSACGTSTWIVSTCESFLTPTSMCAIIFIAACLTSFSTGSSWSVFAIFIPIAVSLAISIGAPVGMAIGVVLSGGIFGDHCSPISDTTVMSSMGSSCDHIDHVRTQLPYALTVAGSSLVGYIVSGLMKGGAFVGLAITLVLICLVSFLLNKHVGRGKDAKAPQDAA